ncbi:hypothetical protein AB0J21_18960 [Streptomyces sp. NPDC049954]|uniref:hypothetical protein n=1 Tax=Streptomyces sp. NPDC049954 TaxID=3155779 RepID=UPI003415486D
MSQPYPPPAGQPGPTPQPAAPQDAAGFGPAPAVEPAAPAGFGPAPSVPPQQQQGQPFPPAAPSAPGQPFPAAPAGFGPAPAVSRGGNPALGVVAAVVAALVTAGVYGWLISAIEREVGYAAVGVGFLVGFAAGKLGGTHPALAPVSAVLSLGAVVAGQLLGVAMLGAKESAFTVNELLLDHFGMVKDAWQDNLDLLSFLFLALAAFAAFSGAKKAAAS